MVNSKDPLEQGSNMTAGAIAIGAIVLAGLGIYNLPSKEKAPIAFNITISTAGKVAHLVMPRNGAALCQKGVEELSVVKKVDQLSQDISFQHEGNSSGYLNQDRLSTNTSPENLYTFTRESTGRVIFRVINRDGTTTKKLYTKSEKDLAVAECNKK